MLILPTYLGIIRDTITRAEWIVQNVMTDISIGNIPPHFLPLDLLIKGLEAISTILPRSNTLLPPTTSGVL